jgi:hypothetical protein
VRWLATITRCSLLAPIAAGELSRFLRRRRPDWPLWISAASGTAPLAVCWPLIEAAREYSTGFFARPSLRTILDSYQSQISLIVPFLVTMVVGGGVLVFAEAGADEKSSVSAEEHDDWVAAATLVVVPIFAYAIAIAWTGALVPRHYLPWTLGFSILLPTTIARLKPYGNRVLTVLACVLLVWIAADVVCPLAGTFEPGPAIHVSRARRPA